MNITFLETFVCLSRLRSFSRTAEKLHATQPAISHRIRKLELELGVELYDKNAPGFHLTAAGERALSIAETIVDLAAQLRQVPLERREPELVLDIGVHETVAICWLPLFLNRMRQERPNLKIKVHSGTSVDLVDMVAAGSLHFALASMTPTYKNVVSKKIGEFEVRWLANPNTFDCTKEIDAADLNAYPLGFRHSNTGFDELARYLKREKIKTFANSSAQSPVYQVYSLSNCGPIIEAGMAIIAVPVPIYRRELDEGRLAIMPVRQVPPPVPIYGIYRMDHGIDRIEQILKTAEQSSLDFVRDRSVSPAN